MIPHSLMQQYGSPHLPRLDAGGLAYRPSGIYSMNDQRTRQAREFERQRETKKMIEHDMIRRMIANAYSANPQPGPTLSQIIKGQVP